MAGRAPLAGPAGPTELASLDFIDLSEDPPGGA